MSDWKVTYEYPKAPKRSTTNMATIIANLCDQIEGKRSLGRALRVFEALKSAGYPES